MPKASYCYLLIFLTSAISSVLSFGSCIVIPLYSFFDKLFDLKLVLILFFLKLCALCALNDSCLLFCALEVAEWGPPIVWEWLLGLWSKRMRADESLEPPPWDPICFLMWEFENFVFFWLLLKFDCFSYCEPMDPPCLLCTNSSPESSY